jgi:hypothetical protein
LKTNRWAMPLWPVNVLLVWIQHELDLDLEEALSLLVGHAKVHRMNLGAAGWPYHGMVVTNSRTKIRDLVSFLFPLGLRCDALMFSRPGNTLGKKRKT